MAYRFITVKLRPTLNTLVLSGVCLLLALFYWANPVQTFKNSEYTEKLNDLFATRNEAMLKGDIKALEPLYNRKFQSGLYAFEHEVKKLRYLNQWAEKQGAKFIDVKTIIHLQSIKQNGDVSTASFIASTEYTYSYNGDPSSTNMFCIGTYHYLQFNVAEDNWLIIKEWYTDPFADSLHLDDTQTVSTKQFILTQEAREFSNLSSRRAAAVKYADNYCGAASDHEDGFQYNKKYRNYNPLGGNCANFVSQALYEGGKFKKTSAWTYKKNEGSKAWINAQAFTNFMLYSGRASLLARGSYSRVLKASYRLQPGDFIAYEKDGEITHVSFVTAADSKGYTLVNSHNSDRFRVPWDLGWGDKGITFWFIHVNY